MIPEPSKRPFGHPLPSTALLYLVHPKADHKFAKPFRDASGNLVTWNGALAVRIRSFMPDDLDVSPTPWEASENSLHWPDPDHEKKEPGRWRPLDDAAGDLWRFGPKAAWVPVRDDHGRPGVTGATFTTVMVGASIVVPVGLLQLAARLPRCRVRIDGEPFGYLQFLWKGGEAVIRPITDLPGPRFKILKPRTDLWTKSFTYDRR